MQDLIMESGLGRAEEIKEDSLYKKRLLRRKQSLVFRKNPYQGLKTENGRNIITFHAEEKRDKSRFSLLFTGFVQLFGQITLPVTFQQGFILINTKILNNIIFAQLILYKDHRNHCGPEQDQSGKTYSPYLLHKPQDIQIKTTTNLLNKKTRCKCFWQLCPNRIKYINSIAKY